ncbi:MAG: hypothetical protein IKB72_06010 [Ruminococcus sp.]|nr:hypothetical protein [Ruminococcus sp.]
MKSVSSLIKWILFVPVCLLSVAIALFNGLYPDSVTEFLATNRNGVAEIIAFSVLGLFLACFVISLFDRKMSPAHLLRKNYFCGVVSVGAALAMAANAAFDVTNMVNSADPVKFMSIITVLLTGVGGVTMLYLGLNHFSGANSTKKISLLYLVMPLWCAAHLIDRFLNNTATPVAAGGSLDLIMFVALAMFFVNVTMIHAVIPVKNSVKSAINFGLPAVVISFVYSISQIFDVIYDDSFVALNLVPAIAYAFIALYAMGFVAELSFRSKTVDEQIILGTEDDENEFESEYYDDTEIVEETEEDTSSEDYDSVEQIASSVDDITEIEEDIVDEVQEDELTDDAKDEESTIPSAVFNGVVRIVQEDDDSVESAVFDNSSSEAELSEDESVADELFKVAKKQDIKSDAIETIEAGSESEMILDGNSKRVEPSFAPETKGEKPKGPTTREAIMYEDDEFILSVDSGVSGASSNHLDEDVSAFILDSEESETEAVPAKKSYEERLDEIDKLIISIQGGDAPDDK